jgi:hypothetical protein
MPTMETFWDQMGEYNENCILFAAGACGLVLTVRNWNVIGRSQRDEQEIAV